MPAPSAAPVTAHTLPRPEQLVAARTLRGRVLPSGFEHEDDHCPRIGDLAPEFAKYLACYRTPGNVRSSSVDAASVARLVSPLQLVLDGRVTNCGPLGGSPYGKAVECTSIGAINNIAVVVNVLLGSSTSVSLRWTHIKLEVEPSLNLVCPTGGSACIVGAP